MNRPYFHNRMDLVDKPMKTIKTSIYRLEMIEMNLNLKEIHESYICINFHLPCRPPRKSRNQFSP